MQHKKALKSPQWSSPQSPFCLPNGGYVFDRKWLQDQSLIKTPCSTNDIYFSPGQFTQHTQSGAWVRLRIIKMQPGKPWVLLTKLQTPTISSSRRKENMIPSVHQQHPKLTKPKSLSLIKQYHNNRPQILNECQDNNLKY